MRLAKAWLRARLESLRVSPDVIEAVMSVPREEFCLPEYRQWAYNDDAMPVGAGQTISQPSLVARMVEAMRIQPEHTVLDVGTGSGYQAAILSRIAKRVIGVEREPELTRTAAAALARLGYTNVEVHQAGDELGWPGDAPYDSIVVGAAAPNIPDALVRQLKAGGRLVIPVGGREQQYVMVVVRTPEGTHVERHEPVRFVPLIGEGAWNG
jgi:protein-L-isoaspartate(D-aspartate) O-methyltransferase